MKILSIGNSFSQDAHRYIHEIAKTYNLDIKTTNLYIGGCPLRTHYLNMLDNKIAYLLESNGISTDIYVSLSQVLRSVDWDIVTLQQASFTSVDFKTYTPYIENLVEYVKKYCPHAKIYIHETWAYPSDTDLINRLNYTKHSEMYNALKEAYAKAKELINPDGYIPSGSVVNNAISLGLNNAYRDSLHMSYGAGRYLLALTWLKSIVNIDVSNDTFNDLDEPITKEEREIIIQAVNNIVK